MNNRRTLILTACTASLGMLILTTDSRAAVIYTETFSSGSVANNVVSDTGSGITWYSYATSNTLSLASSALTNSSASGARGIAGMFATPQSLSNVGDSVRFDFQVSVTNGQNNATGFRFGLINKNGAGTLTGNSTSFDLFKSYFSRIALGGATATTDLTAENGTAAGILGGGDSAMTGSYTSSTGTATSISNSTTYFLGFEVKKQDVTNLKVSLFQNTNATTFNPISFWSGSILNSAIGVTSFDGLAIGISQTGGGTGGNTIDNIYVTAVPEPSTWAMLLGGLGLLIGSRRSRRKRTA